MARAGVFRKGPGTFWTSRWTNAAGEEVASIGYWVITAPGGGLALHLSYSLGHRNPQGLAWHHETKTLYASEHGPSGGPGSCCHDEINIIEPGKNYGWPEVAGAGGAPRFVDPIAESGAHDTWAPSGIAIPSGGPWRNNLLVTALRGTHLRRLVLDPPDFRRVSAQEMLFRELGRLRDVVQGPDGTLYLLTSNRDGRGRPGADDDRLLRVVFR